MQAARTLDLPCPWVPLQSITAAASRRFPDREEHGVYLRGKATFCSNRSAAFPVPASTPEGVRAESPLGRGQALGTAEPDARSIGERVSRMSAEASIRGGVTPRVAPRTRTSRQRASPGPGRSLGRVLPRRRRGGVEATLSGTRGKP